MEHTNPDQQVIMTFKEGIVRGEYLSARINLDIAKFVVKQRKELTSYKNAPILVDIRKVKSLDKDARTFFSSNEGTELLTAAAILTNSKFTIFLANFFQRVNLGESKFPMKMFDCEEKAINWLKKFQ